MQCKKFKKNKGVNYILQKKLLINAFEMLLYENLVASISFNQELKISYIEVYIYIPQVYKYIYTYNIYSIIYITYIYIYIHTQDLIKMNACLSKFSLHR